jgi:hypothetical protein
MKNNNGSTKTNLILHLIKSCENYDLIEKESIERINKNRIILFPEEQNITIKSNSMTRN